MKRVISVLIAILILLPLTAAQITVEKGRNSVPVVISELGNPSEFELTITNLGETDQFEIYSLVGIQFEPRFFSIESGQTKTIKVQTQISENIREHRSGLTTIGYQIKGIKTPIYKDALPFNIVPLQSAININAKPINPGDDTAFITIENTQQVKIEEITLEMESRFFEHSQKITLNNLETKTIRIPLDTEKLGNTLAGSYLFSIKIVTPEETISIDKPIEYAENPDLEVESSTDGTLIKTTDEKRTNRGNIPIQATISISRGFVSSILTSTNPAPTSIERADGEVTYIWRKDLVPGESLEARAQTNFLIPILVVVLAGVIIYMLRTYLRTALTVKKTVSFVKTKGDEFALKVTVRLKAHKHVTNIKINERLPGMAKLYEKFGRKPDKFDERTKLLSWNIPDLNSGEERIITYIIYSKMKILGKIELSPTHVSFDQGGKNNETLSNRTFFVNQND